MTKSVIENNLLSLCFKTLKTKAISIERMPNSGSNRKYYRITLPERTIIGVFNNYPIEENNTFVNFTYQLKNNGVNVPEIIAFEPENWIYLLEDLGDLTLLDWLNSNRKKNSFPNEAIYIYKKVLDQLIQMQIVAGENFDYNYCYQHKEFNKESILFDLNYFKEQFLSTQNLNYNEEKLDKEFGHFVTHLLEEDNKYFMFRDFQARNIMLVNNNPFFIDYQGGRKGPLQYDLASLLYQAKAQIPENIKVELIEYYITKVKTFIELNSEKFRYYFYSFALVRVLQTLGAYGLRGIKEKKKHFIESIPLAINNLKELSTKVEILNELSELKSLINQLINSNIYVESIN